MAGQFELPLGRLVMNFGALEFNLLLAISELVSAQPEIGQSVATPLKFADRIRVFDAVVRAQILDPSDSILVSLKTLTDLLTQLNDKRNSLVHAPWIDVPDTDIDREKSVLRLRLYTGSGLRETLTPTTPEAVEEVANQVHAGTIALIGFMTLLQSRHLLFDHTGLNDHDGMPPPKSKDWVVPTGEFFGGNSVGSSTNPSVP